MKQKLCKPCAKELERRGKTVQPLEVKAEKITCKACGRRRYGVQYEVTGRARKETVKAAAFLGAWLVIAATAEAWATPISDAITPDWAVMTPAEAAPVVQASVPLPEPSEVPEEDQLIELALLEQGYYSDAVPLDYLTQDLLRSACAEAGLSYPLALAVIERETRFRNIPGDDGASAGYMQIQARWHRDRMDKLGVTDLMDPYGNFRVGCGLLAELIGQYGLPDALTVYNRGTPGNSEYAQAVLAAAERWAATLEG